MAQTTAALLANFCQDLAKLSNEYAAKLGGASFVTLEPQEGKKKKRKKRTVDPNAPKRPQSAYVKYLQDTRPKIVKDNPNLKQTEIMAKIGSLWTALPDAKKKKYQNNYEKELKKWEKEYKKYQESKGITGGLPPPEDLKEEPTAPKTPEKKKASAKRAKADKKEKKEKPETPKKRERASDKKGNKRKASGSSASDKKKKKNK